MARVKSTSEQDMPSLLFPCVCFHTFNDLSDEPDADLVSSAHSIFGKLCPSGVKIVKVVYSKLPPKEGKETTRCRWIIIYCLDDDAQLSTEEAICKIRWFKPAYTTTLKEVPYYVNMRLYIAVDYFVRGCRIDAREIGGISGSKVPKHYKNGKSAFIDSTRLEAIEYIVNNIRDPVREMCLMLKLNHWKKEQLDNWLVEAFQDCLPEHFDLLARYETEIRLSMSHPRHDEYPTLLHFAARFGLDKFVLQILERPESAIACHIKNKYDMTPAESAENDGRLELAMMIRIYTSLNQFCNMYSKLKKISHKLLKKDEDSTISPDVLEGLHRVCFPLDYFYKSTSSSVQHQSLRKDIHHDCVLNSDVESAPPPKDGQFQAPCEGNRELRMEILSDFNNLVQSGGADLEKLVEDWIKRNNVQKSFKEKKEQLKEMGQRYEKIELETKKFMKELKNLSVKEAKILERACTFLQVTQTQDKKHKVYSAGLCSKHSRKPVNTSSSPNSSGTKRTIKEASGTRLDNEELKNTSLNHNGDNFEATASEKICSLVFASKPARAVVYTNRSVFLETIEEKTVATPDTFSVKEKSGTQLPPSDPPVSDAEESYEEYVMLNRSEATHDENEANYHMNDGNDNRVENASCTIS